MGIMLAALLWGFAEATLFFIIPDVIISYLALKSLKKALLASCLAVGGALIGGTLLFFIGSSHHEELTNALLHVPAIQEEMITDVETNLHQNGLTAVLLGPLKGIPYKLFASEAHAAGISFLSFFLISIPARLFRFILASLTAWFLSQVLFKKLSLKTKTIGWFAIWIGIYSFYFSTFGF